MSAFVRYEPAERDALRRLLFDRAAADGPRTGGEIVAQARRALHRVRRGHAPAFLRARLRDVAALIRMLDDPAFDLPVDARLQALVALRAFAQPRVPAGAADAMLWCLDDALIIDLAVEQLADVLREHSAFRAQRRATAAERRLIPTWLWKRNKGSDHAARRRPTP
jgi:hypothetical protein